jgi:NAD(P)-dependent dehydrogenase (short-subunit alcohol dehydrogenase family)
MTANAFVSVSLDPSLVLVSLDNRSHLRRILFDIVFANAGIAGRTATGATDEAVFENIVNTDLNAVFFTVNSAVPLLNPNAGVILNGSVHNYLGQSGMAAYAATKGGVVSMARAIAADLAPRNIRANIRRARMDKDSYLERWFSCQRVGRRVRQSG